ncbi:hypothetical protein CL176_09155 [Suicoccus acidiformans]|uniref:Uncharacterized protein n=1 Tax=Suicoccus acidiformans TaxID=2036206 RepID=A0A347WM46_9LACT|nr:hypothetical protein [Suicoccus acidiformans]AXY26153.1 hypothetical protein CL176_09155 [Suicoccus acidiformans]
MRKYTVTADVNSDKFGQGQLIAHLNETEFIEYANLSDQDKLSYLKDKGAEFRADIQDLGQDDVTNFTVQTASGRPVAETSTGTPQITRKMRMNINGQDTGWVDVNEENEAEYNALMEQFNTMHQQFNERFRTIFSHGPGAFLGFNDPASSRLSLNDRNAKDDETEA